MLTKLKVILVFLFATTMACAGGPSDSSSDSSNDENNGSDARPVSQNATTAEPSKALQTGETWSLLTEEDVLTTRQDVVVYRTSEAVDELCILSPGLQFIILSKANSFYRIRLDLIAQDENCPLETQSIGYVTTDDIEANSQAEFEVGQSLEPHTLTFDLKIFRTAEKSDVELCSIAKGNPVLVNQGDESIQVPYSSQCGDEYPLGYYRYVPGIWYEDQPK
ncbi:MAG: hypothetical protein HRU09_19230 [Oligoflexales bacterium]|nr:hypothetical protein [Oligoflexales bacterium]